MKVPTTLIIKDNKINLPQVVRRVWYSTPVLAASLQNDPLRQQGRKGMFGGPLKPVLFPVRGVAGRTSFYVGSIIDKAQKAGAPLKKIFGVKSGPERDMTLVLWWDETIPHAAR